MNFHFNKKESQHNCGSRSPMFLNSFLESIYIYYTLYVKYSARAELSPAYFPCPVNIRRILRPAPDII